MLPGLADDGTVDGILGDVVALGEFGELSAGAEGVAGSENVGSGELRAPVVGADVAMWTHPRSMLRVLFARAVFEIVEMVVERPSVPMVHFAPVRSWTDERLHHEMVDERLALLSLVAQCDPSVPADILQLQEITSRAVGARVAAYATVIGNRVGTFPSRDVLPILHEYLRFWYTPFCVKV